MTMVGAAAWLALFAVGARPAAPADTSAAAAARASNQFGFDLYLRVKDSVGGNALCSPVSASIALTMAAGGARGRTLAEMTTVLRLDALGRFESQAAFGGLREALNQRDGREGLKLQVANRLWGQNEFPFNQNFLDLLQARHAAPLATVDFVRAPEPARAAINDWAAAQTHGRIREIIGPGVIKPSTRLVLTSAVYFKGRWLVPFERTGTAKRTFTGESGKTKVKMMHEVEVLRHAHLDGLSLIELPYRGGLAMVVLLPDDPKGLSAIEGRLATQYDGWVAALRPQYMDVELPRWTTTSKLSLAALLAALGMPSAFSEKADFSGMSREALSIEQVLQNTFIAVDEAGTEAAAVTAVVAGKMSAVTAVPIPFHANRPFLYVIRDPETGAVLFVGRIVDPV